MAKTVRIGCPSGFWGDSDTAPLQLVQTGDIDYLVFDFLAEITMGILARVRQRSPDLGYCVDFVDPIMTRLFKEVKARGIKVVANAGAMNPRACADALRKAAAEQGVEVSVAAVDGDDLMDMADGLRGEGVVEWRNGMPLPGPDKLMSMNAYLGATPIRAALDAGADIVVTGRCVDAATVIGVMMHAFDWADTDYDRLAQAAVAGHLVECGTQVTGGVFTDWAQVPGYTDPGYPIAECDAEGNFVLTKPDGTGGIVNIGTVSEQLVYEIGDPRAYFLPDVTVDLTGLTFTQEGPDRVRVRGAKGRPPTATYKVCATYADGFCSTMSLVVAGGDAKAKAERLAETVLARCRARYRDSNLGDFTDTRLEIVGTESLYGDKARPVAPREVYLHLAVAHAEKAALAIFSREMAPMLIAGVPGVCGYAGGRPKVQPVVRVFSFLIDKSRVTPAVTLDGAPLPATVRTEGGFDPASLPRPPAGETLVPAAGDATVELPLIALAWARSGDKGNDANIGIIARDPAYMPVLRGAMTEALIADRFGQYVEGGVERYELPGIHALNFMLRDALGGGGPGALRNDPQGKAYAQMLLDLPVRVPADWARDHGLDSQAAA